MRHSVLLFVVVVLGVPSTLNYSGFCISKGKWLSDDELIRQQITELNRHSYIQDSVHFPNMPRIRYASVEEFISENPDCCKLAGRYSTKRNFGLTALDSILGVNRGLLTLQFKDYYSDKMVSIRTRQPLGM